MSNAFVDPYIPEKRVNKAILSKDSSDEICKSLQDYGIEIILMEPNPFLPKPLASHTDMQMVNVIEGVLIYAPGISEKTLYDLKKTGYDLIKGSAPVGAKYPFDVAYNCAIVGENAFLNPKYTDFVTMETIKKAGIKVYPVKQGYAKCSTCIVSKEAIITADPHIHAKALEAKIDALLIMPQHNIILRGYNYGFIGGSCGLISDYELAIFGEIKQLQEADAILKFCKKHGKKILSLSNTPVCDLGGLFPLSTV